MKSKRKNRKTTLKRTGSRRKPASKVNKGPRLANRKSWGSPNKSRKKPITSGKTKMSSQKQIADVATIEDETVKHVKKLLGDETIEAIPGTEDEGNLLQDLDLLVLGSSAVEYERYRELLRQEYSHLDDNSYKQMRLKCSDEQPSTSQQAIASQRKNEQLSTRQAVKKSPRQKKPFVKFKDDQQRTRLQKKKSILSRATVLNGMPATKKTKTRTMENSSSDNQSTNPYPTADNINITEENIVNISGVTTGNDSIKIVEDKTETESLEGDCVCIDPQPDVILIDDESIVSCSQQVVKPYEPIGTTRMNQWKSDWMTVYSQSQIQVYGNADSTIIPERRNMESDEVVVIDDTIILDNNAEQRPTATAGGSRKRRKISEDDSVIFVSEQISEPVAAPEYIPLSTQTLAEESFFKTVPSTSTPKPKRPAKNLFNPKEQKQLEKYNNNAYNPNKGATETLPKKRMVIVDGSNVAYHHSLNKEFSVKGLKICLDYFEKMGHEVKAVVPQFRRKKLRSSDPDVLEKLHQEGKIVFTPCKSLPGKSLTSYDDRFVLQLAAELDAAVVSNDHYRDLIQESPALKKVITNRVIGYTWCNDLFMIPKDPYGKWGPPLSSILNRS